MAAKILDGKAAAKAITQEVAVGVADLKEKWDIIPRLGVILATDNPASRVYVNHKKKACESVGMECHIFDWTDSSWRSKGHDAYTYAWNTLGQLHSSAEVVLAPNDRRNFDACLLQLPIEDCGDPSPLFSHIDPRMDVDCFHPENVGLLVQGRPRFRSCTPQGIMELLRRNRIPIDGNRVTIINASDVVGKPLAAMMIQEGATVTVCHRRSVSDDIRTLCRMSDIVVVAVGIPGFLDPSYVCPGSVVVDVGISRVAGKIVGDVHPSVRDVARYVTPVPGGVGPLTIACLLRNVLIASTPDGEHDDRQ
jgi:methylenetetrahydrofolate dehydrogenase (NADP+)/methenyltetrahydrofolate cyclohydrolase